MAKSPKASKMNDPKHRPQHPWFEYPELDDLNEQILSKENEFGQDLVKKTRGAINEIIDVANEEDWIHFTKIKDAHIYTR